MSNRTLDANDNLEQEPSDDLPEYSCGLEGSKRVPRTSYAGHNLLKNLLKTYLEKRRYQDDSAAWHDDQGQTQPVDRNAQHATRAPRRLVH